MEPLPRWVEADGHLRAHRRRDGVHRAGRRPGLRAVRGARGLPPRHPREHRRHRRVLGAGLPAAAADRVGRDRRRAARRAARVATAARSASSWSWSCSAIQSAAPDDHWSPYYKVTAEARRDPDRRRHRSPRHADHLGQQHPAPDRLRGRRPCSTSSRSTPSRTGTSTGVARPGPHRRRRQRQRRRGRAGPGRQAHRRGRDRPGHPVDLGERYHPEPPVPGPPGDGPHRRRPGLHRAGRRASTTSSCSPCPTR